MMTNQYYLISQLPGLDGLDERSSLPMDTAGFKEVSSRFLSPDSIDILDNLSLVPPRQVSSTGSHLVDEWNRLERLLRLALGSVRASNMKKSFDIGDAILSADLMQTARSAVAMEDPLAAEQFLNRYRLEVLDRLRPLDAFCEDAVYYYGLKLMLLERIQRFDKEKGMDSYQRIYHSILNGDNQEK